MSQIERQLLASTPFTDRKELAWLNKAAEKSTTFDELADSEGDRFVPLDVRLSAALLRTFPTDLSLRVRKREQEMRRLNQVITGRQCVCMVFKYYKADAHMSIMYGFNDFMNLQLSLIHI